MIDRLDVVDLKWASGGDFIIENGDIADTYDIVGLGFIQDVEDRVKSSYQDWYLDPSRGSSIEEFEGEINNEDTWEGIENTVSLALQRGGFLHASDFTVTVAPIDEYSVAARIDFNLEDLDPVTNDSLTIKIIYDLHGTGPFILR